MTNLGISADSDWRAGSLWEPRSPKLFYIAGQGVATHLRIEFFGQMQLFIEMPLAVAV
jgi:hypothetical protein